MRRMNHGERWKDMEVEIREYDPQQMQELINENRRSLGLPPQVRKSTDQFEKVEDHGRIAFSACAAVWNRRDGTHVALCAPTIEELERAWEAIVNHALDRERVQKVLIISATSKQELSG